MVLHSLVLFSFRFLQNRFTQPSSVGIELRKITWFKNYSFQNVYFPFLVRGGKRVTFFFNFTINGIFLVEMLVEFKHFTS